MSSGTHSQLLKREESLHSLYLPALAFERLSITFERPQGRLQPTKEETEPESSPRHTTDHLFPGLTRTNTHSVTRKPIPESPSSSARDITPSLPHKIARDLEAAGIAAQNKRKKRRVSTAFSEMLGMVDEKEDVKDGGKEGEAEQEGKRVKRLTRRLSRWFGKKMEGGQGNR